MDELFMRLVGGDGKKLFSKVNEREELFIIK